jgi:hypothetical protein
MAMIEADAQCYDLDSAYWRDNDWDVHDMRPFRCGPCEGMPEVHHITDRHPYDKS